MMNSETFNLENFSDVDFDENYFKFCNFEDLAPEGHTISSDFVCCDFKRVDWYWGLFTQCNFVKCRFTDCVFRGTAFPDCRFVECIFKSCQFVKDNLNADCYFDDAFAYGCVIENTTGFAVDGVETGDMQTPVATPTPRVH